MRKNKFMRAASGLLVAVLLTTCVISGTFAKYTTTSSGTDKARVATWGFKDTTGITLTDLFKNSYDKNVQGTADVIAPGTTNSANFQFEYTGQEAQPEVAYTFTVSTNGSKIADDIKNNSNIEWKLDNGQWGRWDDMLNDIKALSGDSTGTMNYDANKLPTAVGTKGNPTIHTVYWQWKFEGNDVKDTEMGNKDALDEVELHINITATQVD